MKYGQPEFVTCSALTTYAVLLKKSRNNFKDSLKREVFDCKTEVTYMYKSQRNWELR